MQNMPESMSELEDTSANEQMELEETSVIEPMVQAQEQVQHESMIIDEEPVYDTEKPQDVRFLSFEASPQSKESSRSDMGSPEPLLRHTKEQEESPNANPVSQEDRLKAIFSTGSEKLKQALQSLRSNSSASKSNSLDKKDVSIIQEELSSLLENTRYSMRNGDPGLPEEAITLATQILGPEYSEEIKNLSYKSRASIDDSNTETPADIPQPSVDNEEVKQPEPEAISVDIKEQEMADEPMEHFDIASEIADATEEMDRSISTVPAPLPIKASMKSPFLKNKLLNNVADFSMIDDGDESFIQIMSDLKKIQESLGDDDDEDEDMNKEEYDFDGSISDSPIENLTFKQLQEEQRLKALQQKEEAPQDEPEAEDQIEDEVEDEDEIEDEDEVEKDIEAEVEDDIEDEVEEEIDQEELHTIPEAQAEQEVEVEEQPKKLVKAKSTKGKPFIKSLAAAAAAARKQQEQEEKRAAKAKEMEAKRKGLKALEPKPLPQPPKRVLRSKAKEATTTATQPESKFKVSSAAPPPEKGKLSVFKKLAQAKNTIVSSASTSKKTTVTTAVKPLPKIPSNVGPESKRIHKQQVAIPEDGADVESDDNHNYNELEGLDNFLDPLTPERKLKSVITTTTTTFESIAIEQNGKIQLPDIPSDESDNETEKPEVPEWAQSPNLKRALMNQSRINPEAIFGKIPAVNMEELFGRKSSRYKLRQSSVWQGVDKLTFQEEMEYEKRMGWRS
ncbi:hypothetical protein K7432_005592 [Basidiobolus ranarum]|uniref:Inner centromere protein ARK-binding domain-containing protein n=1 Tax=Basidiobolus ranarum TaxID=34480 RepID=A0ABR2W2Z0_9FUNG